VHVGRGEAGVSQGRRLELSEVRVLQLDVAGLDGGRPRRVVAVRAEQVEAVGPFTRTRSSVSPGGPKTSV